MEGNGLRRFFRETCHCSHSNPASLCAHGRMGVLEAAPTLFAWRVAAVPAAVAMALRGAAFALPESRQPVKNPGRRTGRGFQNMRCVVAELRAFSPLMQYDPLVHDAVEPAEKLIDFIQRRLVFNQLLDMFAKACRHGTFDKNFALHGFIDNLVTP
jgi:hypothetical protein